MFGATEIFKCVICCASFGAIFSDLRYRKIYNSFNVSLALTGFLYQVYFYGWDGSLQGIAGLSIGLLLYGWMFKLKVLGGGDVKYLMALGCLGGPYFITKVAFLAFLFGGIMALLSLVQRGQLRNFLRRVYLFLLCLFQPGLDFQPFDLDTKSKIPYGLSISLAALLTAFGNHRFIQGWIGW